MNYELAILSAVSIFAVLTALGVLLSKDNFYSALYMATTMLLVAAIYALYNLQPVVVLLVLVFVGAVSIVTVALAATYRTAPARKVNIFWSIPAIIIFAIAYLSYFSLDELNVSTEFSSVPTDYFNAIVILFSLIAIVAIAAVKIARRVEL
ncbi:MAG: hypothetical protein NZ895_00645 [Archaeoglobaceae archaeon]|nr:hypothetical protein [Archaeoglobaceae archaeon]MCX8151927.1 hypothetical protein [Archaeoglobaceae archaeon]MDW8013316.1 hypothetical protein [Archaeoglobaceae archaeon]